MTLEGKQQSACEAAAAEPATDSGPPAAGLGLY